ncbi:hypothetical protein [Rugosimonospora africana]|uniref:hypothetical protein n=1 Tax=Rugosimonospora africana TaxID=556532 RepID=UPI0019428215|nr:hypothetical protein [Rugosimonospora africana]
MSSPGSPDNVSPNVDSDRVRIRVGRVPWFSAMAYLFGGLAVVVNVAVPLLLAGLTIRGIVGSGGFVWPLVMFVVLAGPCYLFARFGIALVKSGNGTGFVAVGLEGFALDDRMRLPWERVRSVAVTGQDRRARFVVLAEPLPGRQRAFDSGRGHRWCAIPVRRMDVTPDGLRSLLIRQCPEAHRAKLVGD